MAWLWSHRPRFLHLGLFIAAYVVGCGFAQLLAIVPGTGISIWPPAGLFIATLILAPWRSWPWWVLSGCLAELFGNVVWFHSPLPAAFLIYVGNALEAMAGAWLVNRTCKRPVRLETLQEVLAFIVLAAGVAPVLSATVGSATLAWFGIQSQSFATAWPLWWIGDATGVLIVAPLALVVFQNWRDKDRLSTARWIEAAFLGVVFLGAAALSLSGYLAFAYIIMPPLLWAAVRFEFKGAAVTLTLLALIAAVFTISGASQFAGDPESQRHRQVMLQLFLAISAFSALIVAAMSRQYQQAMLTLRQSQQQLQQMIDAVPALILSATPEGKPIYVNRRFTDVTGATLQDITAPDGSFNLSVVHPDDRDATAQAIARSFATGVPYLMRYRQLRRDGSYRWSETRAEPARDESGAIVQWCGVSVDIHDLVTAQEALRERERELSQLVAMVPSLIWRLGPDGEPIFFNKRLIDFFGPDIADLNTVRRANLIKSAVHPDDAAEVVAAQSHSIATGEHFSMRYRLRRADGVYRWMLGRAEPMRDEEGRIVQWYGLTHDIDDQMHAEEALRERERFLWQVIETLPAMIDCAAPDGEPIYRSQQLRAFLGYELEVLDGTGKSRLDGTLDAGVHPDDVAGVKEHYAHSLSTGEPYARRHRLRRFDGEYRWVETRAAPTRNAEGAIVQWNVICLDIDGEVRAQQELRQAQEKMARASQAASLAELSASIAHEVNQPLAAIVATSHACRRWLSADPPNLERAAVTLERIIRDANSASEVVSRIRALFSQVSKARAPADLTEVISEVCRLMRDELANRHVQVETEFDRDLPPALIDRVQMQQVLVNLIRNAIDAFDMTVDGARLIRLRAVLDGDDAIRVEVRDLGAGMKEPERAFEPFFTTKENGMGMGLAICRSIVESHDGRLWATSNQPRGTALVFTLPIQAGDLPIQARDAA